MHIVILEFKLCNLHNPWHTQKEISIETELEGNEEPFKTKASWDLELHHLKYTTGMTLQTKQIAHKSLAFLLPNGHTKLEK